MSFLHTHTCLRGIFSFASGVTPPPDSTSWGRLVHWLLHSLAASRSSPAAKHPLLTVSNWLLPHCWIHLYPPSQVCSKTFLKRPCTRVNAEIMKPAPLPLQLGVYIFISHVFTLGDSSPCPSSLTLWRKAKGDLNVSLARLFIRTMRWILIITESVTCTDMSRDLQEKKRKKNHWFSIFVTLVMIRVCGVFFRRCELRRVNNQPMKRRNCCIFSNNVRQVKRAANKAGETSSRQICYHIRSNRC